MNIDIKDTQKFESHNIRISSNDRYIVNMCPKCKSNNVEYSDNEYIGDYYNDEYRCSDCGLLYYITYEATTITWQEVIEDSQEIIDF